MTNINGLSNVALIILNYNSAELTIKATKHLLRLETLLNIIVVDNYSTDDSRQKLSEEFSSTEFVHLVFNDTNFGYPHGNNVGITYAERMGYIDTVAIMNPDVIVDLDTFKSLTDALNKNEDIAFITCQTYLNGAYLTPNECAWRLPSFLQLLIFCTTFGYVCRHFLTKLGLEFNFQSYYDARYYDGKQIAYVDVVQGCFFVGRLKTFLEVGKLDESTFLYYEENILGEKVRRLGKKNAVLINHFIQHNHQVKDASLIKRNNKIFDMTCLHNSRDYFIREYFDTNFVVKLLLRILLNIDFYLRKLVVSLTFKD